MDNLEIMNIVVLIINAVFIYKGFFSERKRKFEDILFERKLQLYQEINERIYNIVSVLNYSSEPFNSIHRIKKKDDWIKHHDEQILPLLQYGFGLSLEIHKDYGILLPENILSILDDFSFFATRMVVESVHFDGEIILDKQNRMIDKRFELLDAMRRDLGVDEIDESLRKRIREREI